MGIRVGLEHRTTYRFDRTIDVYPHVLRLRPAPHCRTPIESYSLTVSPTSHFVNWQQDPFGNYLARLVFNEPTDHLEFTIDLTADLTAINPFDFFVDDSAETFPFSYDQALADDLAPYLRPLSEHSPALGAWLAGVDYDPHATAGKGVGVVDFLRNLNQRMAETVDYSIRMEPGVQTPQVTLERGIGSCRDTGWLLVEALRRLGLAARFVSGYLVQLTADPLPGLDRSALDGPEGPTEDFTDLHAWAEVYIPGAGWIGLDPTSGLFAGEGHIPLACTPHPSTAAPVTGAIGKAEVEFDFANTVQRIREDPRVTLPYSNGQWSAIDLLGHKVDRRLAQADVRLTMGGEPTFISVDDMDGPEWNTDADSPAKQALAADLAARLRQRFGPQGLLQHGHGKWYPGEPLPRWRMGITWRHDEEPIWLRDDLLIIDPQAKSGASPASATDAARFLEALSDRLAVDATHAHPAYEDPVDLAWREARLPLGAPPAIDVSPTEADRADDPDVRRQLIDRLSGSVSEPAGYVLPLVPAVGGGWLGSEWHFRRGRLYLTPGDSPIGLRLPLDSLAWDKPPEVFERSAFEAREPLQQRRVLQQRVLQQRRQRSQSATGPADRTGPVDPTGPTPLTVATVTALTIEPGDDHLRIFLPPIDRIEDALELVSAIETVADSLDIPVLLEGYPLPNDPRVGSLVVTPDPGVIEVNVQPSKSWPELRQVTEGLYTDARLARLSAEKFDLDGTHTGTGGGNHITLGGATPADSPLLRRPDLLRSLVTYWQHHPSLSYLFSGRFIGPTSQAPRVDEGRVSNIDELDIAFAELDRLGENSPSWMVDRLFRHLLVDLTGNTHRSEFCIDKLYSPDSERGRLGLLELRAMEMPPHPQMALVQSLLVRSLVTRFWDEPYQGRPARWGAELHDRFLLPWFVKNDIDDVIDDLNQHDLPFDHTWLDPFHEFRFPLIGELNLDSARLEVRGAVEPWNVLGEEVGASGTARYVDSSVERLQVLVEGFNPERHVITCNGVPVPLHPTSTPSVGVAGIRYKAWAPPSGLHPTIGVHDPLTFDLIDRWSQRSLGGGTYRVVHGGGLAYDHLPVNAYEAETRRQSRFSPLGHTPGRVDVDRLDSLLGQTVDRAGRWTLDLRRYPEAQTGQ